MIIIRIVGLPAGISVVETIIHGPRVSDLKTTRRQIHLWVKTRRDGGGGGGDKHPTDLSTS
jgi:hypothetical protein